jgi:hypothetical protein
MMNEKDIEEARFMAKVWKLNDERNKRIEAEKSILKSYTTIDPERIKELVKSLMPGIRQNLFWKKIRDKK